MCGVFGFVAKKDTTVNPKILERIARVTMRRGPHAWGMSWIDTHGTLKSYKQSGRVVDALALLSMAHDAQMLIGHCRWATHGDPDDNRNNHPHAVAGGYLVHNGVIERYTKLVNHYGLNPVSECDSEVLGLLMERETKGDYLDKAIKACLIAADRPLVMLGLFKPGRLVAVRMGNPLHMGETPKGFYLASLADGLPGTVTRCPDMQGFQLGED